MKIFITGSNGQLGCSIREIAPEYTDLTLIYTDIAELDITDSKAVLQMVTEIQPDVIVNCAAYTAVDKAEKEEKLAEAINHHAVSNLAIAARKNGSRFIHISTDYLFDGSKATPYHEKDIVRPRSVYGITKLEGETALLRAEIKSIIIRTSWLYSAYGNNFLKTMLRFGREKEQLGVVFDQIGTPTYAGDLARVIMDIIRQTKSDPSKFVPGIYHFSNEGVASWYDFAKAIFEMTPAIKCSVNPIDTAAYPLPAARPAYSVLNKSKIKTTFGISIPYWRDSLKICLNKLQENDNK